MKLSALPRTLAGLGLLALALPAAVAAQDSVTATDLRCDYRTNPVGIDDAQPRLQLQSSGNHSLDPLVVEICHASPD